MTTILAIAVPSKISYISTGGGASLEFMEGKNFASLDILDEKE